MGAPTASAQQVDKRCYKNQTAGWIGVVKLDHLGGQIGAPVEPHGVVWLTDDEATLTARAPAQAKDNPFIEQPFEFEDQEGKRVIQDMAPLVLVEDSDDYANQGERFVPGREDVPVQTDINLHAVAAARADADTALSADSDRPVATHAVEPTPVPASSAAVHPSLSRPAPEPLLDPEDEGKSWTEPDGERTAEPQRGSLGGSNEKVGPSDEDTGRDGSQQGAPPQQPAPLQPPTAPEATSAVSSDDGTTPVAEEHAGVTEAGEETGAAQAPLGEAPEGEFAQHEEIGSPEAPAQVGDSE